jgi:hypothetical protein
LRVGLIVEGSHSSHQRTGIDLLKQLWGVELARAIGFEAPAFVFGFNKGNIASMQLPEGALRRTTSMKEPLDAMIERLRRAFQIECFLVVFDLSPPWDKQHRDCRWKETLAFYQGLSLSQHLDIRFQEKAAQRFLEMSQRTIPSQRICVPKLEVGSIIAVCMEPLFESGLLDEKAMRKCLKLEKKRTVGWPNNWDPNNNQAGEVIAKAVDIARKVGFKNKELKRFRNGYNILKTEWGIFFVKSKLFDQALKGSGFGKRLLEIAKKRS